MRVVLCVFAILLLLAAISCGTKSDNKTTEATGPVDGAVASADSVMIHYTTDGNGDRALVFVHGWSCDRSYWANQMETFKDNYTVVAIDLAGHGESGANREAFTMEAFGEDVAAVVRALDLKEVILVGHSMGGKVIVEAARRLSERVVAIIGADTFQDLKGMATEEQMRAFVEPFRQDFVATTDGFVRSMFPPDADSALVEWVAADMASAPAEVAVSCFENLFTYDTRAPFEDMRKPVRAVNCDMWPTDIEGNSEMAESFDVMLLEGIGHFVMLEDAEGFNTLLAATLAEFWPPEGH
ncbi:MAG: alpha/beta hydrolase [candidate division Zixibacteria bacterium]|nr:alpha/beta hydrolase [candidate division Zixibacteria bacterium]